jgi:phosphoserine phosphatase
MGARSEERSEQDTKAVIFDLDGTLVRCTTVCLHLSDWLGHRDLIERLEHEYEDGQIDNTQVAAQDASFYEGRLRSEAWEQLADIPVIGGIEETVAWLHAHEIAALLATVTHRFAADYFADRYSFDDVFGCEMDEDSTGRFEGTVRKHVEAEDKVRFLREHCQINGITPSQCVAVGDGRSDIPLFAEVGLSIALNGNEATNRAADHVLASEDLTDIITLIS